MDEAQGRARGAVEGDAHRDGGARAELPRLKMCRAHLGLPEVKEVSAHQGQRRSEAEGDAGPAEAQERTSVCSVTGGEFGPAELGASRPCAGYLLNDSVQYAFFPFSFIFYSLTSSFISFTNTTTS